MSGMTLSAIAWRTMGRPGVTRASSVPSKAVIVAEGEARVIPAGRSRYGSRIRIRRVVAGRSPWRSAPKGGRALLAALTEPLYVSASRDDPEDFIPAESPKSLRISRVADPWARLAPGSGIF